MLAFELWGALMGSVLAYMIFTISAFSVPLIYEGRTGLVQGQRQRTHGTPAISWSASSGVSYWAP